MGDSIHKLLLRQIRRHFGSIDQLPDEMKGFIQDVSNTYANSEDDIKLLQNSIEISSQELRDGLLKQKQDAEAQKTTINNIKEAIFALNPSDKNKVNENETATSDSSHLFDSLIKLIEERNQAEEEILKLSKAVEQNPASIVITDINGDIEYVNPKFCNLTGYTKEEAIGKNPRILKSDSTPIEHFTNLWNTILSGMEWQGELQNRKKNGELYWESALISPIINENKVITHFIAIKEDITERKRAEAERIRQSGLITSLLDSIPDIIFFKDTTGKYLGCNIPFAEFVGKPKSEIVGKSDFEIFDTETAKSFVNYDTEMLRLKLPQHNEEWITYPDGRRVLLDTLKTPYWASDGSLVGLLGISRDITLRKESEEALYRSSKKWEAIIAASPDGIGMVSLDGKLQLMSDKLAAIYGFTVDQKDKYVNKTVFDFIDPSNHQLLNENIQKLIAGENDKRITEYLAVKEDGSQFFVDVNSTVLFDADGLPESILFVERDITGRKQAEELLQNERSLFRTIIDLIPDAVYVKDVDGKKIIANPKEVQFAGKSSEDEIIGKTDFELYPDKEANRAQDEDQLVMQSGNPIFDIEGNLIDKIGQQHWLLGSKVPLRDMHGKIIGLVGVTHDITERKQAEEALQQAADRLAIATKAGGVGIWDYDLSNDKLFWDNQMYRLYGFTSAKHGEASETWRQGIHPEDLELSNAEIQHAIKGEKEYDIEFRVVWPDGSVHNVRALAFVVRDDSGRPIRMVGTNWDITDQKNTEAVLLKAKQEADIANKAKSEFLANMSHEIRTPLNGVIGFTDLLLKTPLSKIQKQYAENVNTSGHSLLGIINDILDFSKIEAGKMELDLIKTDVIEIVEQTSDIIKYHASQKGLELLLNIEPEMPRFAILDPIRLKQILVNLIGNAVKFTESGEVELSVTFSRLSDSVGNFKFSVRDTGIGISEIQQKKLFKAFMQADSSTTRKFGGTGLGLTISSILVEKMGGKIELSSVIGKGSDFYFTLELEYEIGEKLDYSSLSGIKRVLVIDDNDNNRMILDHTFKNWGIEFVGSDNGLSALKIIETSRKFDVIIVDYHMPYINGLDTIKMIREQLNLSSGEQPIILLHSSSDDIGIYEECKRLGVRFNLTKPVKSQELLHYLKSIQNPPLAETKEKINESANLQEDPASNYSPVVLVVEDVMLNMLLMTTLVKQIIPKVVVLEAKNGLEAVEMTMLHNPDLIFMDVQMPVKSGIEATMEIRNCESAQGRRIPIVALTAGAIKGEKERCLDAGMDDFLTKPLDRVLLQKILDKHLNFFYAEKEKSKIDLKNTTPHFDESTFVENIGNSQVLLAELLEVMPIQFATDLESLDKAILGKNLDGMQQAAHSIRGVALNMCFNRLAEMAGEIEHEISEQDFIKSHGIYNEILKEWGYVQLLIQKMKI
jgi:PAS domain S-box-containing protein